MRMCLAFLAAGFLFIGGLSLVKGADEPKPKKEEPKASTPDEKRFKELDKDNDGKLSKEEFTTNVKDKPAAKARQEAMFTRFDKDKDGFLSLEEFKAFYKAINKR